MYLLPSRCFRACHGFIARRPERLVVYASLERFALYAGYYGIEKQNKGEGMTALSWNEGQLSPEKQSPPFQDCYIKRPTSGPESISLPAIAAFGQTRSRSSNICVPTCHRGP